MRNEQWPDRYGEEVAYEAMEYAFWRQVESRALRWLGPEDMALFGAGLRRGIRRFMKHLDGEVGKLAIVVEYVRAGEIPPSER